VFCVASRQQSVHADCAGVRALKSFATNKYFEAKGLFCTTGMIHTCSHPSCAKAPQAQLLHEASEAYALHIKADRRLTVGILHQNWGGEVFLDSLHPASLGTSTRHNELPKQSVGSLLAAIQINAANGANFRWQPTALTPNNFYTKHPLHQKPLHKTVLHQTPITRNNFYTKYLLDQITF